MIPEADYLGEVFCDSHLLVLQISRSRNLLSFHCLRLQRVVVIRDLQCA